MKPEDRALLIAVLAVVVVAAAGGAYLYIAPPGPLPTTLPIFEGTTFSLNDTYVWAVYFNVSTPGLRLVGAWTAYNGAGDEVLWLVNGTAAPPGGPVFLHGCPPTIYRWSTYSATMDQPVDVGPHTLLWAYGCTFAARIVVTESIRLTPLPF